MLKEIHRVLLAKGRGSEKEPGEFRRSQNWFGGTRPGNAIFVPPPAEYVSECASALERFLHGEPARVPLLVKAGLAHVQFETIHPFLDGNGRLGRLLITFLLCADGALQQPMLYLSLYFKQHRQEYYDLLQSVRTTGDWEAWLRFFFTAVKETSDQALGTARALLQLFDADRERLQKLRRAANSALRVHAYLQRNPIATIARIAEAVNLSHPTIAAALRHLEKLRIVRELTGGKYGRSYTYDRYLNILAEDTEPLK